MSLQERIRREFQESRRTEDRTRTSLLSTLVGDIDTRRKSFKSERDLTDDEILAVVRIYRKNLEETASQIRGTPSDRAAAQLERIAAEDAVLRAYVPDQMGEAEIREFAANVKRRMDEIADAHPVAKRADMGVIMAALKATHPNAYDGRLASTVVRDVLAG